jgi:hypothetical protein
MVPMTIMAKGLFGACAVALALSACAPAQAQAPDPKGCTPQERANGTLSNQLDKSNGVMCPPDVDPAMKAPTPSTGDKSVIPPPGTPGGDPSVQPK